MSKKIPFLQMFAALCQWQELAEAVEGWVIVAAAIDKASRSALVTLDGARGAGANLIRQAEEAVARCYGLASVKFQMAAPEPETPAEAPAPAAPSVPASAPQTRPAHPRQGESTAPEMDAFARTEAIRREALRKARGSAPAARPKGKGEGKPSGKTIFGHVIKKRPTPIGELELDMGMVVIEGDVFAVDNRELKKRISLSVLPSLYEDIQKIAYVQRKSTSEVVQEMMEEYRKRNIEKLGEYDRLQTEV